jgi:cystathionine gamma-synthase
MDWRQTRPTSLALPHRAVRPSPSLPRSGTLLKSLPFRPETIAVHAGRNIDPGTAAVTAPIHLSTIFERDNQGVGRQGFEYGRDNNPNRAMLETCLAALEGGHGCVAFASGMAAITAVIDCLPANLPRRLLLPEDMYFGLRGMLEATTLGQLFETALVDMTDLNAVANACTTAPPGIVWIETPSNPLVQVTDIAAVAAIARQAGARVVADNTFATPVLQRPLLLGADLVVQSATKYIGGNSDLTAGAVIARQPGPMLDTLRASQTHKGAVPSPFDCWLALRSLASLVPRIRAHCANAAAVATHLSGHRGVRAVHYPGLPTDPGHAIARTQMTDFGGMISIEVAGGRNAAQAVAANLRLFTRATSFGDAHSLVEHRIPPSDRPTHLPEGLLRLSIGLEHPQDLIDDLDQALNCL